MHSETEKILLAQKEQLSPTSIWLLFLFFGWSYGSMGKMGLQILWYLTLGGCGIWTIIRLFTLNKAIRKYNERIYEKYGVAMPTKGDK